MGYRLDPYEIELLWIVRAKKRLCSMAAAGAFRKGVACVIDGYHGLKYRKWPRSFFLLKCTGEGKFGAQF